LILSIAHDTSKLTVDLLYELHSICMRTTNILPIVTNCSTGSSSPRAKPVEYELKYTNINVTREATKKNVVIAGPPRVQFCPFDDIIEELGRFVHLARVRYYIFLPSFDERYDLHERIAFDLI
jgi:hypothetical protein